MTNDQKFHTLNRLKDNRAVEQEWHSILRKNVPRKTLNEICELKGVGELSGLEILFALFQLMETSQVEEI